MKLNTIEKALMNNPARALLQRSYEASLLVRLGDSVAGGRVLELGCGRGVGTQILFERFGAAEVHAFDLDPDMVKQARRRLAGYPPERLRLWVGDASAIATPEASYDAVFDFGALHHVPNWQQAVAEISRVLRPGGRFFFEEVTSQALRRFLYRAFLDHPGENRFDPETFIAELTRVGIPGGRMTKRFFGDFFFGVGQRSRAGSTRVTAAQE